jgi:hypothetical protein
MVLAGAITCLTGGVLCRQCSTCTPPGRGRGGSSANVNTTTCCAPLQQSDCISDGADCSGAGGSSCPSPCTGTLPRHCAWEHTSLSDWGQPLSSAQWHQSRTQWVVHQFIWWTTEEWDLFPSVVFIFNYKREWNVRNWLPCDVVLYLRRMESSTILLWKPEDSQVIP